MQYNIYNRVNLKFTTTSPVHSHYPYKKIDGSRQAIHFTAR